MRSLLILLLLFFIILPKGSAQDLTYDIILHKKPIGKIIASQKKLPDGMNYSLQSMARFSALINIDYHYQISTTFMHNMLTKAYAENRVNNKIKASSSTQKSGDHYEIKLLKEKKVVSDPISYSMINLYFEEPRGLEEVYSERYGEFLELYPLGKSRYRVILPDGRKITYQYKNGKCVEIVADHALANVYFRLKDQERPVSSY